MMVAMAMHRSCSQPTAAQRKQEVSAQTVMWSEDVTTGATHRHEKQEVQTYLSCISLKEEFGLRWHTLSVFLNTALFLNASAAVLVSSGLAVKHLLRRRSDPAWRAVVSMAVLALAYVLSFVPYHAVRTPYTLAQTRVITDCRTKRQLFLGKEATLVLSMLHVCLDPLLFFYLDAAFRGVIRGLLPCKLQSRGNAAENTDAAGGADGEESAVDPDALHVCRRSPSLHETEDDPRTS